MVCEITEFECPVSVFGFGRTEASSSHAAPAAMEVRRKSVIGAWAVLQKKKWWHLKRPASCYLRYSYVVRSTQVTRGSLWSNDSAQNKNAYKTRKFKPPLLHLGGRCAGGTRRPQRDGQTESCHQDYQEGGNCCSKSSRKSRQTGGQAREARVPAGKAERHNWFIPHTISVDGFHPKMFVA